MTRPSARSWPPETPASWSAPASWPDRVVDAPSRSKLPTVLEVTEPGLAVVRFHGRNNETWKKAGTSAAERFKYRYSPEELREWAPRIRSLAERAASVHALMNNCYGDDGVRNAGELQAILLGAADQPD